MILQKTGGGVWLVGRETEIKKMDVCWSLVLCFVELVWDKLSKPPYTNITVMISFDWTSKTTSKRFTGEKGKTTELMWELRLDMCWLKPFFFIPTHNASWLTSFKKNHRMLVSATVLNFLFFFIIMLQQCHECSVMASSPKKVQNMCFLHSLNAVCVSVSCVFCPSSCWNI